MDRGTSQRAQHQRVRVRVLVPVQQRPWARLRVPARVLVPEHPPPVLRLPLRQRQQ